MRRNVRRLSREVSDTTRASGRPLDLHSPDEHISDGGVGKATADAARSVVAAAEAAAAVAAKKRKANAKAARKATGLLGESVDRPSSRRWRPLVRSAHLS